MSTRPSLSKSKRATPPPKDSTMYFFSGAEWGVNVIPASAALSRNTTCGGGDPAAIPAAAAPSTQTAAPSLDLGGRAPATLIRASSRRCFWPVGLMRGPSVHLEPGQRRHDSGHGHTRRESQPPPRSLG